MKLAPEQIIKVVPMIHSSKFGAGSMEIPRSNRFEVLNFLQYLN